jgi:hypothetical protein
LEGIGLPTKEGSPEVKLGIGLIISVLLLLEFAPPYEIGPCSSSAADYSDLLLELEFELLELELLLLYLLMFEFLELLTSSSSSLLRFFCESATFGSFFFFLLFFFSRFCSWETFAILIMVFNL